MLAVGMAACGGGDDSDATQAATTPQQRSQTDNASQDDGDSSASNPDDGGGQSPEASDFVPRKHNDSGGGAGQLKAKGGDNSVQEFGSEAAASEFDAAAATLHNFLDARAEGNWAAVCEQISKTIIESIEKLVGKAKTIEDGSCAVILESLMNPAAKKAMEAEAEEADVRSLRTDGERAFLLYTASDGEIFSMPMANEDGTWKVASLAGLPLSSAR